MRKAAFFLAALLLLFSAMPATAAPTDAAPTPSDRARQMNEVFDIANNEYKAGNYADAARLYEGIMSSFAVRHADLYFNLGNSCFKMGQYGKAIAAYKRTLLLSPREQDALANLRVARGLTKDKLDSPKSTEVLLDAFFFHYGTSRLEAELIFCTAYCAAAAFGVISLFWKSRGARWAAGAALAVALIFGLSTLLHVHRQARPSEAVVVAAEAALHNGPGQDYLVFFYLHDGAELELHEETDDWYQVELSDGRRGWIKALDVEVL